MSNYANILAQIKLAIQGVDSIGQVHDYERWSNTWPDFLLLFKQSGASRVRGWTITRSAEKREWREAQHIFITHTFVIRGYHELDDSASSEKTFQALCDSLMDTLQTHITYASTTEMTEPPQMGIFENRTFGGVLCHYCEIKIEAGERVLITVVD